MDDPTLEQRVIGALEAGAGPMTLNEVQRACGSSTSSTSRALGLLEGRGRGILRGCRWSLVAVPPEIDPRFLREGWER